MRTLIIALILVSGICTASPVITIDKETGVSWKSLFDAGFRPKHQPRIERRNTLWFGRSFGSRVGDDGEVFDLTSGRLLIEIQTDATVRLIWHQSDKKISFEEGRRRADAFRRAFEPYITQEITMPRPLDPSGTIDAGNQENNVEARVGEWVIWYGFDVSYVASEPLIPHFYIVHKFPGQKLPRVANMKDRVVPPEGYEWYSLDPAVDTPDPIKKSGVYPTLTRKELESPAPKNTGSKRERVTPKNRDGATPETRSEDEDESGQKVPLFVLLGAIAVLGVALVFFLKRR